MRLVGNGVEKFHRAVRVEQIRHRFPIDEIRRALDVIGYSDVAIQDEFDAVIFRKSDRLELWRRWYNDGQHRVRTGN